MTTVDIIIVNWNTGIQLKLCLASIESAQKTGFILSRIVIVDNASSDDSLSYIKEFTLPITVIKNDQNLGFAAACNQGAMHSQAAYLLFLNPDTILFYDSLLVPIQFMGNPTHNTIGIVGIRMVNEYGETILSAARFPTFRVMVGKITGLAHLLKSVFPPHHLSPTEISHSQIVDQVIGAYFLIRREVFLQCNGFDERFFMYFEEVDLSLRAKQKGYVSYYLAEASAFHKGGGSSRKVRSVRLFYLLRSRFLYGFKHYPIVLNYAIIFLTFTIEFVIRVIRAIIYPAQGHFNEILQGYAMLIKYFLYNGIPENDNS